MHPKGHTIIIAVKSLPKIQQEALKRLPLAEGGEVKLKDHSRKNFADAGAVTSDDSDSSPSQAPVVVNVGQPQQSPTNVQSAAPVDVQNPNVNPANPPVLLPNGSMSAPGAAQTGQEAVQNQQKIDAARANALLPAEMARQKAIQLNAQQDQDNINALRTHADNLAANINKIDPDAYRKNMSDSSKTATGIGLILGGLSTPFGGHNFAQDFLNNQIAKDIAAQQKNNENQNTIWGAYNSLYGDQNMASKMAKASMADAYSNQVDQIAAKLGTPQALVNAQKAKSDLAVIKNKAILDSAGNLRSTPNNPVGGSNIPGQESGAVGGSNIQPVSAQEQLRNKRQGMKIASLEY